jgi:uncharacterized membrane protein
MNTPQRRQIALPVLAMVAALAVLLPAWVPVLRAPPWEWIVMAVQAVLSVAMVVYLVRFVRKQRDDYWRERGKDPKHPEA